MTMNAAITTIAPTTPAVFVFGLCEGVDADDTVGV